MLSLVHWLESWQTYLVELGWTGAIFFAVAFMLMQMVLIPVSPLGLAAGYFFGFWFGLSTLMLGCIGGMVVNFLIARHVARDFIIRRCAKNEKFRVIDEAIARGGWKIVAMLRCVPIPFGFANYCYGLTPVKFVPYLVTSSIAILPANMFFVWTGSNFTGGLSALVGKGRPHHPLEYVFLTIGLIAAFLVLRFVAKTAQTAVDRTAQLPKVAVAENLQD